MRVEGKPELMKDGQDQRDVERGATKHVGQKNEVYKLFKYACALIRICFVIEHA